MLDIEAALADEDADALNRAVEAEVFSDDLTAKRADRLPEALLAAAGTIRGGTPPELLSLNLKRPGMTNIDLRPGMTPAVLWSRRASLGPDVAEALEAFVERWRATPRDFCGHEAALFKLLAPRCAGYSIEARQDRSIRVCVAWPKEGGESAGIAEAPAVGLAFAAAVLRAGRNGPQAADP